MNIPLKLGSQSMVAHAMERAHTLEPSEAIALHEKKGALFVDIREPHEIDIEGMIPGAVLVPRGTLEFRIDPNSNFFWPVFEDERPLVLYCQLSSRSALAVVTLMDMGVKHVSHIGGGFSAWKDSGGPIQRRIIEQTER